MPPRTARYEADTSIAATLLAAVLCGKKARGLQTVPPCEAELLPAREFRDLQSGVLPRHGTSARRRR